MGGPGSGKPAGYGGGSKSKKEILQRATSAIIEDYKSMNNKTYGAYDPKKKEFKQVWDDGKTYTTYSVKNGVGNNSEGTRRALVVREDKNGNGVYAVLNYSKYSGKINYFKKVGSDERQANREYDSLMARSLKGLLK